MSTDSALLVLDMQNDFCRTDGQMYPLVQDELRRRDLVRSTLHLARAASSRGVLTVLAPIRFDYSKPRSSPAEGILAPILEQRAFPKDGAGGELIEELEALKSEPNVIEVEKPGLSAFTGTSLHERLSERGISEVVIAGLLTNWCVENTARSAFDLGYRVRIVGDATATFDAAQQEHAEKQVFPMLGRVIGLDEFAAVGREH